MNRISKLFALIAFSPMVIAFTIAFIPQGFWLPALLAAVPLVVTWDLRNARQAELDEIEDFANTNKDYR